jgi:hypothetical protein
MEKSFRFPDGSTHPAKETYLGHVGPTKEANLTAGNSKQSEDISGELMICPKCGYETNEETCPSCGVIFAKIFTPEDRLASPVRQHRNKPFALG